MTSSVLVTGGTGTLGRHVLSVLRHEDCEVRVLTRRPQVRDAGVDVVTGDLATGDGLEVAVTGVTTIVHCASNRKGDADATRNLIRAASAGSVSHLVYISLVGTHKTSRGYARTKLDSERVIADSPIPWTIQRATQFYDLILGGVRRLGILPVIPVPAGFIVQPVDSRDVAQQLARLALAEPAGYVPDMAGPQVLSFADLMRGYLEASGHPRRKVVSLRMPGTRAIRAGSLLPAGQPVLGQRTWAAFLAESQRQGATASRM